MKKNSGYYATVEIADHAVRCLQEHQQNHSDAPFFHYLAFTAPHFPLHALPEDIAKYADTYKQDWEAVRRTRWQKQKQMGLLNVNLSAVERDAWSSVSFSGTPSDSWCRRSESSGAMEHTDR